MRRLVVVLFVAISSQSFADQFDYYTNPVLSKAVKSDAVKAVTEITSEQLADFTGVLPDSPSAFLIIETNDKRFAKMLLQPARQKIGADKHAAILLIDKYFTFKGTGERTLQSSGQNLQVYPGLRLSLEIGQIVPEAIPADLAVIANEKDPNSFAIKPVKDAKIYVLTKPIAGVVPKKAAKLVVGEAFESRFFAGKFKLHDDGRRSGEMKLTVNDAGEITGTFTSDKDGREYDIQGKVGNPKHAVSFSIKFPATTQTFNGFMFTGNGKFIAGTTKMLEREAGFIAERIEE